MRFLPLLCILPLLSYAEPVVNLGGTVVTGGTLSGQEYFRGIPYAEPPVGNLRFKPPQLKTTLGVASLVATSYGPGCLQPASALLPAQISEDCLTLNIQRPAGVDSSSRLPVLVWIYGGTFIVGGSSTYNADTLIARSVARGTPTIYVGLNYRVGPLGFPTGQQSYNLGILNLGLKDQSAALAWIQANIAAFGGDPSKVTLFGESAGSIAIGILRLQPDFHKLARATILESGMASSTTVRPGVRGAAWNKFVSDLGCTVETTAEQTLTCLQQADAKALRALVVNHPIGAFFFPELDGPSGVLPDYPSRLLRKGKFTKIPILLGTNLDENTLFTPTTVNSEAQIRDAILAGYQAPGSENAVGRVADRLLKLYPDIPALGSPYGTGNETFGMSSQFKRMASLLGDMGFVAPTRFTARTCVRYGVKTYGYLFTERHSTRPAYTGVAHGTEIPYVYGNPRPDPVPAPAANLALVMMDYWLSFASALHPNDGQGSNRLQWTPYTARGHDLIQLDGSDTKMIKDDFRERGIEYIIDSTDALGI